MGQKYYVLMNDVYDRNIISISSNKSKLETIKEAMDKRNDEEITTFIEEFEGPDYMYDYAKEHMSDKSMWRVLIFASGKCIALRMDFEAEVDHFKKRKSDINETDKNNFEIFVRADDQHQAETIARERLSQYKSKSEDVTSSETKEDIVERGIYKLEFSIDYIQSKKFEASFVVNMKDNLKFIKIDRYILYDYDDKFITDDHNPLLINIKFNPRKDKMVISVVLYIQEAIPKEKLIEITKPFVCEEIFRRFIKP